VTPAVSIRNFSKSWGNVRAVSGLDLEVFEGELFGLIGPDGAGKTTTMRTLVTLLPPDEGEISVAGRDARTEIAAVRARVGYMPQRFSLYQDLSVDQNLSFFADLSGVPKTDLQARKEELYGFNGLKPFSKRLAGRLSGGMKQKLALSCTLIHHPRVLVLDEPTTGVDPVSRNEFWRILRELKAGGATILVSTPYMDEADMCDRVAVMHGGRLLLTGAPEEVRDSLPYAVYEFQESGIVPHSGRLQSVPGVRSIQAFGDSAHLTAERSADRGRLEADLSDALGRRVALTRVRPSLEDVFIDLVSSGASNEK